MTSGQRYGDALAILELAALFKLYPFHNSSQLAAWQLSLAGGTAAFQKQRLELADTLSLIASARLQARVLPALWHSCFAALPRGITCQTMHSKNWSSSEGFRAG